MPLFIVRNDITKMHTDAIVNAAAPHLLGGGGVDGAIHTTAGPGLLEECRTLGGCETGQAKVTNGYNLHAKHVIHTVGPVWYGGNNGESELLRSCYAESLRLACELGCESIAFPLISSGVYGYPKKEAFRIAADTIESFLETSDMTVFIVIHGHTDYGIGETDADGIRSALCIENRTEPMTPEYIFRRRSAPIAAKASVPPPDPAASAPKELTDIISKLDAGFSVTLLQFIDRSGKTDPEIYRRANIDRRLFSKIRSDPDYRPSKATAIAFAIALELNEEETEDLIGRAGYRLSGSSKFDVIIRYFIEKGEYDVFRINEALFAFDQPLLGA